MSFTHPIILHINSCNTIYINIHIIYICIYEFLCLKWNMRINELILISGVYFGTIFFFALSTLSYKSICMYARIYFIDLIDRPVTCLDTLIKCRCEIFVCQNKGTKTVCLLITTLFWEICVVSSFKCI